MTMTANHAASTLAVMANFLVEVAVTTKLPIALEKATTMNTVAVDAASATKLVSVKTVQLPASESHDTAVIQAGMMVLQAGDKAHGRSTFSYDGIATRVDKIEKHGRENG